MYTDATMRVNILDLSVDGPTSFAALYCALNQHYPLDRNSPKRYPVDAVWGEVMRMLQEHLLRVWRDDEVSDSQESTIEDAREEYASWLPSAVLEDLSYDRVGLWLEVLQKGKVEWVNALGADVSGQWMIDVDFAHGRVVVYGTNAAMAEDALRRWQAVESAGVHLSEARDIRPVSEFTLRSGGIVRGGVRVETAFESAGE